MLSLFPLRGIPLVEKGDQLGDIIAAALAREELALQTGDVLVIAQKVVSKAEGRVVQLEEISPSPRARDIALNAQKDPRLVEIILRESHEVVRVRPGVLVVEDVRGLICANAGVDRSNIQQSGAGEEVALLPSDPDLSARRIRRRVEEITGQLVGVIINDSHGRAFREGTVGVAIGVAGVPALWDRRGDVDLTGYTLQATVIGIADEIAGAASLLMGPAAEAIPAVVVRGLRLPNVDGSAKELQRPRERDLFR